MATPVYPPTLTTNVLVNTRATPKIVYLPAASTIGSGKLYFVKDICGNAANSSIYISTTGLDSFESLFRPSTLYTLMSTNFQAMLFASDGSLNWMILQNYNANAISRPTNGFAFTAYTYLPLATNATDVGTNPQTVTTNGTVTYTTIGGKQCAYFSNSLANYLSFPYNNPTRFTICFWYYPIDANYYTFVSVTTSDFNPALQFDTSSATTLNSYTALPGQWTISPQVTVPGVGNWKFIAWTLDQTTYQVQFYVNGVLGTTATGSGTSFGSRTRFVLGRSGDNGRAYYGYIRQFSFYTRILTLSEINQVYTDTT